jgi:protein tyrosine kinase modulator
MIPGKKYTPDDLARIAWRRRWFIVIPLVLGVFGGLIYAYSLRAQWRSTALIQIVPQRVPESYVRPTVTTRIEDRLESIRQLVLSRTKLETIIQEFDLYAGDRQNGLMEDVVQHMRNDDISMKSVKGDAFQVSYVSEDPRLAMRVTERLAGLFITENMRDREALAESSSQFLESQLEQARLRLQETEAKLAAYRRQHAGELPDQVIANLQGVTSAQMQIQQVSESLNRDKDRRLVLQRQIADLSSTPTDAPATAVAGTDGQLGGGTAAQQLEAGRIALRNLQLRLKDEHPDVIRMKRLIGELEQKAEQEALQQPLSPGSNSAPLTPAETQRRNRLRELETELASLDRQIAGKTAEESRLRAMSGQYQSRVEAAPTRESELISLTRDYETLSRQYASLLSKNEEAKMAMNLERRQGGEQFRLLDPARMPEKPFSPNRPIIILMGVAAGFGLGLALVGFLEYRDRSLRTDDDVVMALALPVLAVIPVMSTKVERREHRRKRFLFSAAGTAALMLMTALFVWRFLPWRAYFSW